MFNNQQGISNVQVKAAGAFFTEMNGFFLLPWTFLVGYWIFATNVPGSEGKARISHTEGWQPWVLQAAQKVRR
jgi:hypothetical protein